MLNKYIKEDPWSLIEEGWNPERVKSSESLFSIGNGFIGQRANFEETYTGPSFQGSYIGGVYYPDKTRVGWWKNGYPEYFAKVLNAPNWIGLKVICNGEELDLHTVQHVSNYRQELNMQEGWLKRNFEATLQNGAILKIESLRFISLDINELGAIRYSIYCTNQDCNISICPYIDANISNQDSNWDDEFWSKNGSEIKGNKALIRTKTNKTHFDVATFMSCKLVKNGKHQEVKDSLKSDTNIEFKYELELSQNEPAELIKYGGYVSSFHVDSENIEKHTLELLEKAESNSFDQHLEKQKGHWAEIWRKSDIEIQGDISAQQGIRFNIFQLNQTYNGLDARLNIGPKGFTGEKYGGSTYWDTEAYCLPFFMATKSEEVALNLLEYRYRHLPKAMENAKKLGFNSGAALYPMVTMNGEECHNEWEITFEEIHRNAAIAYAVFNYTRYTGNSDYLYKNGIEVVLAIARFWVQRAQYSNAKNKWVILGVTGPNEYENNINNNWYTNYMASWCMKYALETIEQISKTDKGRFEEITTINKWSNDEAKKMKDVSLNLHLPFCEKENVFLQQDGFLDKELIPANELSNDIRPINQHWSWDRILRSCYIKQADVLQGFYFLEEHFTQEQLEKHFDFYEPLTVHESSLSPCIHSILASRLGRMNKAYALYVQTSRLDLDDYNHEVEEGCHITSMAGTWLSIVEGFGGMKIKDEMLHFSPQIPEKWQSYSFKINFRKQLLKVHVTRDDVQFKVEGNQDIELCVNGEKRIIKSNSGVLI